MRTRDNKLHFSIRKLTIGAVSVMFGAFMFGLSTNQVHAAETDNNATNSVTTQVDDTSTTIDEAHQTPHAGENYNKSYQENVPSITVPKESNQNGAATTEKLANEVTTQVTISATNKNNGQTSSAKANKDSDTVFVDVPTASDTEATFTISNPTNNSQSISVFTKFPAWFGTHALTTIDTDRLKKDANGNIVFGGDYVQKGLTLKNFDLAIDSNSSTGFGESLQNASKNPALIGGFQITGTLAAGETATVVVPVKLNGTGQENGIVRESIGNFFGFQAQIRLVSVVTDLDLQKGKHYFLVDVDNSDPTHFRSISQTVLNDLAKDGVSPLYQDGDVKFNSTNWFGTVAAEQSSDQPIFENDYIDISGAQKRLRSVLNKYGYDIVGLGSLTGISDGSGYALKSGYNYYDAQGNQIQLGTGNLSNFMIGVKQIIALKDHQAPILTVGDRNYQTELNNLFTDPSDSNAKLKVDSSNVDINKAGTYQVKVSNQAGNISRVYNVIVVAYNRPETTKASYIGHQNVSADEMVSTASLKALKDNSYTLSFETAPSYTVAGPEAVQLVIADSDGNTNKSTQYIDVEQTIKINFVDSSGAVLATMTEVGQVGSTLSVAEAESAAKKNAALADYNWAPIPATKFLAQADDQIITVLATKKASNSDDGANSGTPAVPDVPVEPSQPTNAPVLPENDDNGSEKLVVDNENVRPHAQAEVNNPKKVSAKTSSVRAKQVKTAIKSVKFTSRKQVKTNNIAASAELPKTGAEKSSIGLLGIAVAGLGLLGLAGDRERKK